MEITKKLIEFIKGLEERDIYKYIILALSIVMLTLGLLIYVNYSKVNKYKREFQEIDKERKRAKKILTDHKIFTQQQAKIEQMLAQDKNFLIKNKYNEIIKSLGLSGYQHEEPKPEAGATVSGKTEIILSPYLSGINMKQLTTLLSAIADVPQIYPKELTIKKTPNAQTVDVTLKIGTLEPEAS